MPLALPSFYDPLTVERVHVERAGLVASEAAKAGLPPSSRDRERILAFGIDCQIGFCTPGASLFVPGAVEDTRRTLGWLYGNLDGITALAFSLDTHEVFQIFHPAWWRSPSGETPPPFTAISHEDVKAGRWRALGGEAEALEYTAKLEASGKYVLTVWPFHTLLGGVSHALVPALMEAAIYHAVARGRGTHFELKGQNPRTESYSVLSPEVREVGGQAVGAFNDAFFHELVSYDRVYVFGQAKSHCVLSTLLDLKARILATEPSSIGKIHVLVDAMSPVPPPPLHPLPRALDFPAIAERGIEELRAAGMKIVKTADPI